MQDESLQLPLSSVLNSCAAHQDFAHQAWSQMNLQSDAIAARGQLPAAAQGRGQRPNPDPNPNPNPNLTLTLTLTLALTLTLTLSLTPILTLTLTLTLSLTLALVALVALKPLSLPLTLQGRVWRVRAVLLARAAPRGVPGGLP